MKFYKTGQGRSSLLLAINALANRDKKYIISQAFTCVAVPEAIIECGFVPFWVDIELKTYSLDINLLRKIINNNSNQFAGIIIQHTYGFVPNFYIELKSLAKKFEVPIIEDRCHCNFLNDYKEFKYIKDKEKKAFCYSFENAKPIKLGRGGLLIISNESYNEGLKLESKYKKFKNQSIFKSSLNILIASIYILSRNNFLFWPLLETYRYLASKGILPANFNSYLNDLRYEKIGFFQNICLQIIIYFADITTNQRNNKIIFYFKNLNFFIRSPIKFPVNVNNKKKAIAFCKKRRIPVFEYFNTPIQPLKEDYFSLVNYKLLSCPNAEKAADHIIVFDKLPEEKLLKTIINL